MRKALIITFIFVNISMILSGQYDLGLNGTVTWIDSTHIRVEYDWSNDSQLLDWVMTNGSTLVRESGTVTVTGGYVAVRAMIWKQGIKCSKLIAKNVSALTSEGHHLNFYTNLSSFTGDNYLPNPGLGAVLATYKNFWVHDGTEAGSIGAPYIAVGVARDYEFTASTSGMTMKSSSDNIVYSYNVPCVPALDSKIALGGWGGNTRWGKLTIEGEVTISWQNKPVPPDVINIQSNGAVFAPVIEVAGTPVIEWIFNDSTTSSSPTPVKDYGSAGSRRNYLKVTPWSALKGINVGYDAADGGYGGFSMVNNQNVLGFQNLALAGGLKYICASYNLMKELDLRGLSELEFVELYKCPNLAKIRLSSHPVLERLCVEDGILDSLDISGCTGLEDLRGALNNYTFINWGSIGEKIWHICIRDNPQLIENIPNMTQFPLLRELLIWNTNQTGAFVCHNSEIREISSSDNHYTSADVSGCTNLRSLSLSGSTLTSLILDGASYLIYVRLKDCGLTKSTIDYVLQFLDVAGRNNGYLELDENEPPSSQGLIHYENLIKKGWTVKIENAEESAFPKTAVTRDVIKIWLNDTFTSWKAELFNVKGELLMSKFVESDILTFNVSGFPAGIYFEVLSKDKDRKTLKVFKP